MRRCSPTVVPGLPPTGVAGVGSLRPMPGAFMLTGMMVAAEAAPLAKVAAARAQARRVLFTGHLHPGRGRLDRAVSVAVADLEGAVLAAHRGGIGQHVLGRPHGEQDRKSVV